MQLQLSGSFPASAPCGADLEKTPSKQQRGNGKCRQRKQNDEQEKEQIGRGNALAVPIEQEAPSHHAVSDSLIVLHQLYYVLLCIEIDDEINCQKGKRENHRNKGLIFCAGSQQRQQPADQAGNRCAEQRQEDTADAVKHKLLHIHADNCKPRDARRYHNKQGHQILRAEQNRHAAEQDRPRTDRHGEQQLVVLCLKELTLRGKRREEKRQSERQQSDHGKIEPLILRNGGKRVCHHAEKAVEQKPEHADAVNHQRGK